MSTLTRVVAKERKELIKSAKELKRVAIHNLRLAILHTRADQLDDAIALVDCELNHLRMPTSIRNKQSAWEVAMPTKKEVYDALFAQNYFADSDQQWLGSWLLAGKPISGMRAALIQGDPGTGKTRFTEALAHGFGIPYLFYMCHAWTDDQELFAGIDVAAAVRGDHKQVKTPGCCPVRQACRSTDQCSCAWMK